MSAFTYAELFAGAGGLSTGLELAGWEAVAHAEIEPHARAVLRRHWPDVRLDGDVAQLNGADYRGVTLLSGGSPCQDLSVAGKRAGMTEGSGTRSSLFFDQMRIWHESGAPYCLWENVLGAFSSNNGQDFAAVLSAFVGGAVAVPSDGWSRAGVVRGPAGVAAWRVLDAQFFGVPQRRRRVFVLGARAGGVDPAEVLSLAEGLRGDFATGSEARKIATSNARDCSGAGQSRGVIGFDCYNQAPTGDVAMTISGSASDANHIPVVFPASIVVYDARGNGDGSVVNTLAGDHQNRVTDYTALVMRPDALAFHLKQDPISGDVSPEIIPAIGIPRRLTPRECERLMGWADDWTAVGIDEQGFEYQLSDTARYKLCGNGVASPVAAWIGHRLREAIQATPCASP